jgi:hypothetical protein
MLAAQTERTEAEASAARAIELLERAELRLDQEEEKSLAVAAGAAKAREDGMVAAKQAAEATRKQRDAERAWCVCVWWRGWW